MGGETVPTVTLKMDMSAALLVVSYPELSPCSDLELIATNLASRSTVQFNDEAAATASLRGACERLREVSVDQPEGSADPAGELAAQAEARQRTFEEQQRRAEEAGDDRLSFPKSRSLA